MCWFLLKLESQYGRVGANSKTSLRVIARRRSAFSSELTFAGAFTPIPHSPRRHSCLRLQTNRLNHLHRRIQALLRHPRHRIGPSLADTVQG